MSSEEKYMQRCFELARLGKGYAAPNPLVGSVIVHDNKIIGEGYHMQYGQAHAEVNAVNSVRDKEKLKSATIYVSLEPCAHFGKTPPCADLIVQSEIPRVVIGCIDPFSEVAGKGIEKLQKAGISVKVGVLEKDALNLNRRFFTFHTKKRPYIILKWAQTLNGFMDKDRQNDDKGIFWITQPETKALVHKWRHEEAGILVGKNTVKTDDPALTCRLYNGNSPTRFVIDQKMRLDYGGFKVGDRTVETYILTEKEVHSGANLKFTAPNDFSIAGILEKIHELNVQSVIVEGGKNTLDRFITSGLWDEARILTGTGTLKTGVRAPKVSGKTVRSYFYGKDQIKIVSNA